MEVRNCESCPCNKDVDSNSLVREASIVVSEKLASWHAKNHIRKTSTNKRPYSAADVVSKRDTIRISYPANPLPHALFTEHFTVKDALPLTHMERKSVPLFLSALITCSTFCMSFTVVYKSIGGPPTFDSS